jgi:hypothetical protein
MGVVRLRWQDVPAFQRPGIGSQPKEFARFEGLQTVLVRFAKGHSFVICSAQ